MHALIYNVFKRVKQDISFSVTKYVAVKFINNARCCVKIISVLGHEKEYPLNAKSLKLKIVFRHKDEKKQPQMVTFQGVDVSGAGRIVKFDGQKSISFRPVADGDTYISVLVTSEDAPGKLIIRKSYDLFLEAEELGFEVGIGDMFHWSPHMKKADYQ